YRIGSMLYWKGRDESLFPLEKEKIILISRYGLERNFRKLLRVFKPVKRDKSSDKKEAFLGSKDIYFIS
ncbi:unnamed protein product, partial [marine sediment metagenome]